MTEIKSALFNIVKVALATFACVAMTAIGLPELCLFVFSAAGLLFGIPIASAAALFTIVGCHFVGGVSYSTMLLILYVASILTCEAIRKHRAYRSILLFDAALVTLSMYAFITIPSFIDGYAPFVVFAQNLCAFAESIGVRGDIVAGENIALALIVFRGIVFSGLSLVLLNKLRKVFLSQRKYKRMVPLEFWMLSKWFTTGAITVIIGCVVCKLLGLHSISAIGNTCAVIIGLPLFVQGLCFLRFLDMIKLSAFRVRGLVWVLLALFIPLSIIAFVLLGAAEQVLRIRTRTGVLIRHHNKDDGDSSAGNGDRN